MFELHEEQGLHVHLLTNNRIDVNSCRTYAARAGWGRIHVEHIPKAKAGYLAKYLSKKRPKALEGWRLWASFGDDWERTKVSKIHVQSLHASVYRGLKEAYNWKSNHDFRQRAQIVAAVVERTVLFGWTPGLGPSGKPYRECRPDKLMGRVQLKT